MSDEIVQGREPSRTPSPGGRHRRTLVMAAVVLAFLAVVVVVGIVRGQPDPTPRPSPSPTVSSSDRSSAATTNPPLQLTLGRCAKLEGGDRLSVGFEVENRGTSPLIVLELRPTFPLGGFTPDATAVPDTTSCPTVSADVPHLLGPGKRVVLGFVLTVADPRCVAPLPVDVTVDYGVDSGGSYSETLLPFPDLGGFDLPSECGSPSG